MSRTDKTTPWRIVHARGECRGGRYPCKCISISRSLRYYRDKHQASDRARLRMDITAGREPETRQHRHSARWDAV
jgi:hypothetical protein